jgi:transglutaminase-like putative cysteine protease
MNPLSVSRPERIELICFAALGIVASLQWASLVSDPPATRLVLAVVLATGAGAALAAIARLPRKRATRWALGAAAALAVVLGLVIVGLPARLLLPEHWGELSSNVDRSLNGLTDVPVPYAGADVWTRLVILLAAPLTVGTAAFAAFWPTRRRAAGRICALVLLVGLYLVAVSWARPGRQLAGGTLLVLLVCAWLWLPSIEIGRWSAAGIAIAAAALVAVPAAALVDPGKALIDYRHWNLLSANGISFRWDQSYGPLDWPQKGTLLMEVSSEKSHYWKATNLDTFDGVRWTRSTTPNVEPPLGEPLKFHPKGTAPLLDPEWVDRINFRVRDLTSDFAIGAGTTLALRRADASPDPDGVWAMDQELHPGSSYTALVYDPKPSPIEMRAAGTEYPAAAARYVSFTLTGGSDGAQSIEAPLWGASGPSSIQDQVQGTPYEDMYALARRLATGAATPYDAAHRIELYLRANYKYQQDVPNRTYPLPAFLSEDRAGYCQQFSGTMALMLRMLGIPSRVATGFAPGARDPDQNNYLVNDTDAHNWVEVYFPAIGWATFEPTPPTAPAATQLDDNALGATDPALPNFNDSGAQTTDPRGSDLPAPVRQSGGGASSSGDSSGPATLAVIGGGAGLIALLALGGYGLRARRRDRLSPDELAEAELRELERALARLDEPLPPGTTLRGAEKRLARFGGPVAARYADALEAHRFRDPDAAPPGVAERRALRRALLSASAPGSALPGPGTALRVLLAVPPGGPAPSRRRARAGRMTSGAHPRGPAAGPTAAGG